MLHDCMIDQDMRAVSPTRAAELPYNVPACFDLDIEYAMAMMYDQTPAFPTETTKWKTVTSGVILASRRHVSDAVGGVLWLHIPTSREYLDWSLPDLPAYPAQQSRLQVEDDEMDPEAFVAPDQVDALRRLTARSATGI